MFWDKVWVIGELGTGDGLQVQCSLHSIPAYARYCPLW